MSYQSEVHGVTINLGSGATFEVNELAELVSDQHVHVEERKNDLVVHFQSYFTYIEWYRNFQSY